MSDFPKASIIADYSQEVSGRMQFTKTAAPKLDLGSAFVRNARPLPADSFVGLMASYMNKDPIGGEDYQTVLETTPTNGAFSSVHLMNFNGQGDQAFHFHPPANGNMESSIRHVLLYPLASLDPVTGETKTTTTFEWFAIKDPVVSHKAYSPNDMPITTGKAVSPRYKLELDAGQVTLLSFPAGIHRFGGDGGAVAISLHPLDIETGSGRGSFLGNTAGYDVHGEIPDIIKKIVPSYPDGELSLQPDTIITLQDLFSMHSNRARGLMIDHQVSRPGRRMSSAIRKTFIRDLRADAGYPEPAHDIAS